MPSFSRIAVLAALAAGPAAAADPPKHPPNRLARESSPYLLRHARDPVDWYPWGDEAFAKARKEGKLVFLSSGFDSCHWCHVMARETFADPEVAKLLNAHFVCIKVDREERPDVDHVYLTALMAAGVRGGWPLSVFLTADGKPVAGGTYWPPDDKEVDGRKLRGFKGVLGDLVAYHRDSPAELRKAADELAEKAKRALAVRDRGADLVPLDRDLVARAAGHWKDSADPVHGGFGAPPVFSGAKFPRPPALQLVRAEAARTGSKELAGIVRTALGKMARGGIYDQLGGGFHRYATDRAWAVPHFEKMLADNALLLEVYARGYAETKDPAYARVLRETAAFLGRDLAAPGGGFYAALDAESAGEEGRFYVWTAGELAAALPDPADLALVKTVYGLDRPPMLGDKYYVLAEKNPSADRDADRLAAAKRALAAVRDKRPKPAVDTNVLAGWNGLTVAGLARAGQALGDRAMTDRAVKTADFVLGNMRAADGRLFRVYGAVPGGQPRARGAAYLDDYAGLLHGLLALHDVTGEARWLTEARALAGVMAKDFRDEAGGGFYYTSAGHEKLFARVKDQYDGAQPCGNSLAALALVRLWRATGDDEYRRQAERTFRALAVHLRDEPATLATLAEALGEYLDGRGKK